MFIPTNYTDLNHKQKENYNFHAIAAVLAGYGYNSIRLTDDYEGADFLAIHLDGLTILKIQLKGRLTLDKKYFSKSIYIAFRENNQWYVYPHDEVQSEVLSKGLLTGTKSWDEKGGWSWPGIPSHLSSFMDRYKV
jgi:hypothetical protein